MKRESKTATFEEATFSAEFIGGVLDLVTVTPTKKGKGFVLSDEEVVELSYWLDEAVLGVKRKTGREINVAVPVETYKPEQVFREESPLAPGYVPLDQRSKIILPTLTGDDAQVREAARLYLANPHPSDADTVKHLLPIETQLKKDGMKLEQKDVAAQTVTFTTGKKA